MNNNTIEFYNKNAIAFAEGTVSADFQKTQDRFLRRLSKGDYNLDFGCGSGRDTTYFLKKEMRMHAIDGSEEAFYNHGGVL